MEKIIKGIIEGSCFILHECEYTENKKIININGLQACSIENKYIQYMGNINISITLVNTDYKECPLRFYTYIFTNNVKIFGNKKHSITKYISSANILISHICSEECKNGFNYSYHDNVIVNCIDIKLNMTNDDYNDVLDIFTNIEFDLRSFDCRRSCYNNRYISKAKKNKQYLQNELLKYIGYNNIIKTRNETLTLITKSDVYFTLHI